ncbi:unnamed protein product [Peniophora sp. CBMAI 1063]|nr:unnamed protein product [Peniophora sp. CBMAI 1063]
MNQTPWIGRTALPQTGPDIMVQPYRTGYETPQPRRSSYDHRSASPMPAPAPSRRHSQRAPQPSAPVQHPAWLQRAINSGYRLDPNGDRRYANPPLLSSDNNRSWTLDAQNAGYNIDTERMIIIPPRPEHQRRPSAASHDDGYSTTPEAGSIPSSRQRRGSDAMSRPTTPAATAPAPRRGILKRIFSTNDRAASTPPTEGRPRSGSQNRARPILHIPESEKMNYALHWQLLPYNAQSGKPRMYYDIRFPAEYASHVHDGQGHFPISRRELEKPATKKNLSYMTFTAWDLPIFDIEVHRHEGVRVCDVLERVYEHYQLVLTRTEKTLHRDRVERAQWYYEDRVRQELQRDPSYVDQVIVQPLSYHDFGLAQLCVP